MTGSRWTRASAVCLPLLIACDGPGPTPFEVLPPQVELAEVACSQTVTISGNKQSSTSIWLNGEQLVELDELVSFRATVHLDEGEHPLELWAQSAIGDRSEIVRAHTRVDLTPPAAPTVSATPLVVDTETYELMGTRDADSTVRIDGRDRVSSGSAEWSATVELARGPNRLNVTAFDGCHESEIVRVDLFQDPTNVQLRVHDVQSPTCGDTQVITGERAPGVAVLLDGATVVAAGPELTWMHVVALASGTNHFRFVGVSGGITSDPHEAVIDYDDTPPAAPTVTAPPPFVADSTITVMGTREANVSVLVADDEAVPAGPSTSFELSLPLQVGRNLMPVDTLDFCGRTSGQPVVLDVIRDDAPPAVTLAAPRTGSIVAGVVAVIGAAVDDHGVSQLELSVDGAVTDTVAGTTNFRFEWDSVGVADGPHLIAVVAVDHAGLRSAPVTVTVTSFNRPSVVSSFGAPANGDPAAARGARPSIAAMSDGRVAVAWHDNEAYGESGNDDDILLRLFEAGTVPEQIQVVSAHADDGRSKDPRVAAGAQGGLHIVWDDDGDIDGDRSVDHDIVYRWFDGTQLVAGTTVLSVSSDASDRFADVAADGAGVAHVVWQSGTREDARVMYTTGGSSGFAAPQVISAGEGGRPRVAVTEDGCPHVVWQGGDQVTYRRSVPNAMGGCTFGAELRVSAEVALQESLRPRIAAGVGGQVWVVWESTGDAAGSGADNDIWVRDIAAGVPGSLQLVSDHAADGQSLDASIAVDANGTVHVAWCDNGDIAGSGTDVDVFTRPLNGPIELVTSGLDRASRSPDLILRDGRRLLAWDDRSDVDGDGIEDTDVLYVVR